MSHHHRKPHGRRCEYCSRPVPLHAVRCEYCRRLVPHPAAPGNWPEPSPQALSIAAGAAAVAPKGDALSEVIAMAIERKFTTVNFWLTLLKAARQKPAWTTMAASLLLIIFIGTAYAATGSQLLQMKIIGRESPGGLDVMIIDREKEAAVGRGVHVPSGSNSFSERIWTPPWDWVRRRERSFRHVVTRPGADGQMAYGIFSALKYSSHMPEVQFPQASDGVAETQRVGFACDRWALDADALTTIEVVAAWLKMHRDQAVFVQGHADKTGTEGYNLRLATHRAEAVRDALVQMGVGRERIFVITFGESKLRSGGSTESDHVENRRVEFVYLPRRALQ